MKRRTVVALVLACSLTTACGSQLSRGEIEAAAGSGSATNVASEGVSLSGTDAGDTGDGALADDGSGAGATSAGGAAAGSTGRGSTRASASGSGTAKAATLSTIKLGHIGTYSGLVGAIFSSARPTIQAWARWVNAHGGLNGHPVELVTADDGGDPAKYLSLVRDMVENHKVIAFVGNMIPFSGRAAFAYLEEKKVPVVGGDLTESWWFQSPMYFPQANTADASLRASSAVAVKGGAPKVALLFCSEGGSCGRIRDMYAAGAVEKDGGQNVYTAQISLAQPDFTVECLNIRNRGAQAVVVAADGNTMSRVARSCEQQGVKAMYVSFGLALVNSLASDPKLEGMRGTTNTFPWFLTDGAASDYGQALATYAKGLEPQGAMAAVWSAGELMEAAGRRFPAQNPSANDVLEGLYALKGETMGGLGPPLTFVRGKPAPLLNCYWELGLKGGKFYAPQGLDYKCYGPEPLL